MASQVPKRVIVVIGRGNQISVSQNLIFSFLQVWEMDLERVGQLRE
jgi:hypothetical protein